MHDNARRKSIVRRSVAAVLVAAATLTFTGSATGIGRYTDAVGDNGAAPDIRSAAITRAGDRIVFTLEIAGFPASGELQIQLFVDSDANPSTGHQNFAGADYVFLEEPFNRLWAFAHWTGAEWDWDTPASTLTYLRPGNVAVLTVNRSELSNTTQMNVWARTVVGEGGVGNYDVAPDVGVWNYDLAADGPDIRGIMTASKPSTGPKAGKAFSLTVTGLELPPNGEPAATKPQPERYRCAAKLAGRRLAARGTGGCTFSLPKSARGKRLTIAVTVEYQGAAKTFNLAFRVR